MLGDALRAIPGQTAVVAGRIDGRLLYFRPTGGPERTLNLEDLIKAAEASDVNLIVLQSSTPRQPGGRNWLWQRVTVAGLEDGMARATLSDFLSALADGQNRLLVTASARPNGRVALRAVPLGGQDLAPTSGGVGRMLSDIVSEVTGRVVTSAIDGDLVGSERQLELEARVIPGVPASIQVGYLVLVITGLMGMPVAAAWWRRAWPPEKRESYGRAFGYQAARLIRLACFLLVFLPTVGLPAFVWNLVLQTWSMVRAPVRALRWLAARASQPAT